MNKALHEAVNAVAQHGSANAAAIALGVAVSTLKDRLKTAKREGITPTVKAANDPNRLKDQVKRLEQQLKLANRKETDLDTIKTIVGTIGRKIETLDIPDWTITPRKQDSAPGVPTMFLSDLHWGEVVHPGQINGVNKYNVAIAHERMQTCVDSAVHLLKIISPKLNYPGIVVPLGGDMISGNIHDELTATNEINSMPAVLDLYGTLIGVITQLADTFGAVFCPCVTGNHGRDTMKIWGKDRHHTSFDWLLYQFLAKHFARDKRVTFFVPDGPDAYYRIYEHRYLLTHGDQFRGGDGMIGALGPIIRGDHKKRSRNAQIDMEYDTMICGHWHQYIQLHRLIVNGSLKGYDEYAYSNNFGFEAPAQALWLTHPKYRITYRMPVYVDRRREPAKTSWASVAA
jgi:DNA-binding Lrp family transcriptional regulator